MWTDKGMAETISCLLSYLWVRDFTLYAPHARSYLSDTFWRWGKRNRRFISKKKVVTLRTKIQSGLKPQNTKNVLPILDLRNVYISVCVYCADVFSGKSPCGSCNCNGINKCIASHVQPQP